MHLFMSVVCFIIFPLLCCVLQCVFLESSLFKNKDFFILSEKMSNKNKGLLIITMMMCNDCAGY
jgi:hypothetical protein